MRRLLGAIAFATCKETVPQLPPSGLTFATFHGDRDRLGWNDAETDFTIAKVERGLEAAWSSPMLDSVSIGGKSYEPHLYATPVYADDLVIGGRRSSVVFAATTSGFAYAIAALGIGTTPAGTIFWKANLGMPSIVPSLDGGIPLGVLSTPFFDRASMRLYVVSIDGGVWKAFALDASTGTIVTGWPIAIDSAHVEPLNKNAGQARARFLDATVVSQRSALALSSDGASLYVSFGSYFDGGLGWMVAIDTRAPKITSSFSGSPTSQDRCPDRCDLDQPSAGMWSAGGPSIDDRGRIYTTTGNSPAGSNDAPGVWGQSLLAFEPSLDLAGTYTPYDYCATDIGDADISGSAPILLPDRTIVFGSKQGVVYRVSRDLHGPKDKRPACDPNALDPSLETSITPPDHEPLSVFGPFSEAPDDNNLDHAKMRSTPAFFVEDGTPMLIASGTTRDAKHVASIAPSLVKLRVGSYLSIEKTSDASAVFINPGSPIVSSHDGGKDAIAWVLDENAKRTDPLLASSSPPHPVLYAFDARSLKLIWRTKDRELEIGGKYNHPIVAHGTVIVGTDRIRAFR